MTILRKVINWSFVLAAIQLVRAGFCYFVFKVIDTSPISNVITNALFFLLGILVFILIIKKRRMNISFLPDTFGKWYVAATGLVSMALVLPVVFFGNDIIAMIYNAFLTVIFEELLFRGFIYRDIANASKDLAAYIVSTILFALWHLGYVDTVIYRTSMFHPGANVPMIMMMKVLTALGIGVALGFLRFRKKNVYAPVLLHAFINSMG